MVVVVIVGSLATVGIFMLRKHVFASKSVEALGLIQSIRGGQERWRAETQRYLDASSGDMTAYYPAAPDRNRRLWEDGGHDDAASWRLLNITEFGQVQTGVTSVAGVAGVDPDGSVAPLGLTGAPNLPVSNQPWYLIHAATDPDGNGDFAMYLATSFTGEVYSEGEGVQ
jgi:hypothetical protein